MNTETNCLVAKHCAVTYSVLVLLSGLDLADGEAWTAYMWVTRWDTTSFRINKMQYAYIDNVISIRN